MAELTNTIAPGELAMSGQEDTARTSHNAAATLLKPGYFVCAIDSSGDGNLERRGVTYPTDVDSIVLGVVKKWMFKDEHPEKDQVSYYVRGAVGVPVAASVKAGDPVFAIFTVGATRGQATNVAGVNAVPVGARFLSTTLAGEVAIVSLNLS